MVTEFVLRFDYGLIVPWITRMDSKGLQAIAGPDMVVLYTDAAVKARGMKHSGVFTVKAGETVSFVLAYARSFEEPPPPIDALKASRTLRMPGAGGRSVVATADLTQARFCAPSSL